MILVFFYICGLGWYWPCYFVVWFSNAVESGIWLHRVIQAGLGFLTLFSLTYLMWVNLGLGIFISAIYLFAVMRTLQTVKEIDL